MFSPKGAIYIEREIVVDIDFFVDRQNLLYDDSIFVNGRSCLDQLL